jgi:hypothetical protein
MRFLSFDLETALLQLFDGGFGFGVGFVNRHDGVVIVPGLNIFPFVSASLQTALCLSARRFAMGCSPMGCLPHIQNEGLA